MSTPTQILHFEQNPEIVQLVESQICQDIAACKLLNVKTQAEFFQALPAFQPDLIITAYALPHGNAVALLAELNARAVAVPVIVFTYPVGEATAVACMKAGAVDYLTYERSGELETAVHEALTKKQNTTLIPPPHDANYETNIFIKKSQTLPQIGTFWVDLISEKWVGSSTLHQIFGIDQEYLNNETGWQALVHPDYTEKVIAQVRSFILSGEKYQVQEYPIFRHSDGQERWIYTQRGLEFDETGKPARIVGTVQDITERKSIEKALQDSEFFLRQSQSVARIGSYSLDVKTGQFTISQALDEIFGIDDSYPKDLTGWAALIHPDYRTKLLHHMMQHVLTEHNRFDIEYLAVRHNDKKEIWIHGLGEVELDENGQAIKLVGTVQDITERRQTEEALRLTRYSVDNVADAVYWINKETKFVDVNETACRQLGYTREEMLQLSVGDVDPHFNESQWETTWKTTKKLGKKILETEHRTKDGNLFPVEVITNILEFHGQELNCAFVRDVTARKQAEEALYLTRYSVDNLADAIYWIDKGAKFIDVNETACRQLGYSREEMLTLSVGDIDPNLGEGEWEPAWEISKELKKTVVETQHQTKDGSLIPVEIILNHFEFNGQELSCAVVRDITDRKQAEMRLRDSEERLRRFSDVTAEGIVFHQKGIIVDVNEPLSKMFGYRPDEVIGRPLFDFIPPEEHNLVLQKIAQNGDEPYESFALRKDGSIFPVEVIARELISDGKQIRVASLLDITERKQIELERLENLRFFENLDRINRTFQTTNDIERLMTETLDEVLAIFNCDRAFLMYPVDLEVSTLEVRMERTTPEYPGAFELNKPVPLAPQLRQIISQFGRDGQPSQLVQGKDLDPEQEPWKSYNIKSILAMPLYPKVGKPWLFGLHQCSYIREWTTSDEKLFQAIGRRLADALTAMLVNQELRESQARYRESQRIAQLGHWSFDPKNQKFLWWSEETFRLVGLDPAKGSPTYEEFLALVHPEDHQLIEERLTHTLQTGAPFVIEHRIPLADGTNRVLLALGIAHLDGNNHIDLLTGTVMNITEQKQASEKILYQATLLNNITDAIISTDLQFNIQSLNEAAERLYGWSEQEVIGRNFADVIQVRLVEESPKTPSKILAEKGKWQGEAIHKHKDGTELYILASSSFVVDDQGQRTGVVTVNRDISKRKRTEAALQQSEERLRQAVQVAGLGTFEHDHLTDTIFYSPEMRKMWAIEPEVEITMELIFERLHPEDRERISLAVEQAHSPSGNGSYAVEQRVVHPDGSVHWQSARGRTFFAGEGKNRQPIRTVGVIIDLTEAKLAEQSQAKLEEQLRQAQKLESLGRLAGGIAHDFNNLLVPMIGYTELGLMRLPADSKAHGYFEKIGNAASRAADLTKQILAFSRRQMLEMGVFDLNDVVSGFRDMLQRLIGEDVHMQLFPAPTPCPITADRTQIEQILMNLVINARDAMPQGGQLIIETDTVYLDESYAKTHPDTEPGHYTMLSISDTGLGMDNETQKHIFDPFFTTKARGKGTGLGLATVFGIVKQHQGNIWVYSEPNEGTTFKIYLPRPKDATKLDNFVTSEMPTVYGTETVLVVEDEPMVRKLACETLVTYGYNVLEADNSTHGLQIADTHPGKIDLLLTDVIMPDMNGRELHNKLLEIRSDLKVLFMSGYTDNVIVHHGVLDEGVNFLEKPFTIRHFIQKVRRVLDE